MLVPGGKFGPEMSLFFIFPKPPPFDLTMVREMLTNHISSEHFSRTARPKGGDLEKMKKCDISGPNVPPGTTPKRGGSCDQTARARIMSLTANTVCATLVPQRSTFFLRHTNKSTVLLSGGPQDKGSASRQHASMHGHAVWGGVEHLTVVIGHHRAR